MAKITATDIKDMGFSAEMFGKNSTTIDAFLTAVIAEQSGLLQGRVSPSDYASTDEPTASRVKRAEKVLTAGELMRLRIIKVAGNAVPNGEDFDTRSLERQKKDFLDEAEALIAAINASAGPNSSDYAGGVLETTPSRTLEVPDADS